MRVIAVIQVNLVVDFGLKPGVLKRTTHLPVALRNVTVEVLPVSVS